MRFAPRWRFRDLQLFWKLLVPFLTLILIMGVAGSFLTIRYLSSRAQDSLDQDLLRRSVNADVHLRDQTLYLLESVRFAANILGVPEAVSAGDRPGAQRLLASVPAVRTDLDLLVAAGRDGSGLVEIERKAGQISVTSGTPWANRAFVAEVLQGLVDARGDKRVGFLQAGDATLLTIAGPVRTDQLIGVMIAGIRTDQLAKQAAQRSGAAVGIYDRDGHLVGTSGGSFPSRKPPSVEEKAVRRLEKTAAGEQVVTLYAALQVREARLGTVAVSLPRASAFASVKGTRLRLTFILMVAMAGVVGLGTVLSRLIVGQVRRLVETNRALGRGELSARAPVLGNDELGELAHGLNQMAEQLQASYWELEMRVAVRTEELERLYQEVVKASEARSEFFATISHEFRTPLFAIIGHAETMLDPEFRPRSNRWRPEFAKTIKGSAQDLLDRINDILDLAKFEAGGSQVTLEDVEILEVLNELRGIFVPLARKSDLRVHIDLPRTLPPVRADVERLRQIVLNMMSNAIKYTPAGGEVRLGATANNSQVEVWVQDSGIGIPDSIGDQVFEPFYRVPGTKAQKGQASTGLGLALTKRLVEAHGGKISFKSKPGEGTIFTFSLVTASKTSKQRRTTS